MHETIREVDEDYEGESEGYGSSKGTHLTVDDVKGSYHGML